MFHAIHFQYYEEVLGIESNYLFMPSYGLLLRDDLHHSFDRGEIALYPQVSARSSTIQMILETYLQFDVNQGDTFVVHIFSAFTPDVAQYHGKVLGPDRFRGPRNRRPHAGLLLFHYQQCAMKHFRGSSHGMGPPLSYEDTAT